MWTISGKISQILKLSNLKSAISGSLAMLRSNMALRINILFGRTDKIKLKISRFLVMNFEAEFRCA